MLSLFCPKCGSRLSDLVKSYACGRCNKEWTTWKGLPCFVDGNTYWGEIPQQKMNEINEAAETKGWRVALKEMLFQENLEIYNYVVSPHRAQFKYLFDNLASAKILDIGSGWGTIAVDLAKECEEVTAVEKVFERAYFTKLRAAQEDLHNLNMIICDAGESPLPRAYYDIIILNGALEYIGLFDGDKNPKESQIKFLKKIRTLLKPTGSLYIGIENRSGWASMKGAIDHSGLRYTSLMPRKIADIYCKLRKKNVYGTYQFINGYRTYTYTWKGYKNILRAAGFTDVNFYEVFPGYNQPSIIIPLQGFRQMDFFYSKILDFPSIKGKIRKELSKLLFRVHLHSLFPSHYGIIAHV